MPQSYNASVKWTATLTNRLLAQAGLGLYTQQYREIYRDGTADRARARRQRVPQRSTLRPVLTPTSTRRTNLYRGAFRAGNIFHISGVQELRRRPSPT